MISGIGIMSNTVVEELGEMLTEVPRENWMGPLCPQRCSCPELGTRVPNPWPQDSLSGAWPASAQ